MRRALRPDQTQKQSGDLSNVARTYYRSGSAALQTAAERPVDRLWGLLGITWLVEYKNPETAYGRKGLRPTQKRFEETWRGSGVVVIDCVEKVDVAARHMREAARRLRWV